MDRNEKLKKSIIWNTIGSFAYFFLQWVITYLVTKLLDFDNAAIFSLCMAVSNTVISLAAFGMRNYQVSDINDKFTDEVYIRSRILTCLIATVISIIWILLMGYKFYESICIIFYILFRMSEAFVDVYHGIIQKQLRMDIIGKSYMIRGISTTILFIITIRLTHNLLIGIISMIFAAFIPIYFYDNHKVKDFIKKKRSCKQDDVVKLLLLCAPITIYFMLINLIPGIPRFFIKDILGKYLLGVYSSIAIPAVVIQVCANYIFTPFVGIFSEYLNLKQFENFLKLLIKVLGAIIVLSVVVILGAFFLTDFGLKLLYTEKILPYSYLFLPILVFTSLISIALYLSTILIIFRNYIGLIIGPLISAIYCYFSCGFFIRKQGLNGANTVMIHSQIILIVIYTGFILCELIRFNKASKAFITK